MRSKKAAGNLLLLYVNNVNFNVLIALLEPPFQTDSLHFFWPNIARSLPTIRGSGVNKKPNQVLSKGYSKIASKADRTWDKSFDNAYAAVALLKATNVLSHFALLQTESIVLPICTFYREIYCHNHIQIPAHIFTSMKLARVHRSVHTQVYIINNKTRVPMHRGSLYHGGKVIIGN